MKVSNPNNIKIYNLSAGKSLPEWLSDRKKRALQKSDVDVQHRIQLIQDFEMPTVSNCVNVSKDEQFILATGLYKPRVRCYDVSQMSMKFERCMDSEVVKFCLLSDDYSKIVFLQMDRYVEFHNQNGRYYRTRIPVYGRDFAYHEFSTELYFVGASTEISRLNLELGKFMMPLKSDVGVCEINCCRFNPVHNLLICGTTEGQIICFDPRTRNRIGLLDCTMHAVADNTDISNIPAVTSVTFRDYLKMAIGTSTGQILLYDLRSAQPFLVKDHNFCLPIKDIEFQCNQNVILSCDSRIVKIWDEHSGKTLTSIEPEETKLNDLCVVRDSGMLFLANEAPKILTYYIPTLGTAPKWCSFLDSLTEQLEENLAPTVYDDYKFVTRSELEGLGLSHLIGSDFIRAYMHGFFLDIRLYHKAKALADPFAYEEYHQKKIREKINEQIASKIKKQKLPKVNRQLAEKLMEQEEEERTGKKKKQSTNLLKDDRFSKMFTDADFQVDTESDEYKLLNPLVSKRDKERKRQKEEEVILPAMETDDVEKQAESDDEDADDDDDDGNSDSSDDNDKNEQEEENRNDADSSGDTGRHTWKIGLNRKRQKMKTANEDMLQAEMNEKLRISKQMGLQKQRATLPVKQPPASSARLKKASRKTVGELLTEVDGGIISQTNSTFANLEMTFKLNQKKADVKRENESRAHHAERKKLRRSAGGLGRKKVFQKSWMSH